MKFVVGIGNPEKQYENTRHNVGFKVLDGLCAQRSGTWRDKKKLRSQVCALDSAVLVKPETYVNNTGDAVSALTAKHGASPSEFLFVCDDVNLMLGKIRLRDSGGAGGHHGLESVIRAFQNEMFTRLRVGVGSPEMPKDDLTEFVLGRFGRTEEKEFTAVLTKAVSICEVWIDEGLEPAMNRLSQLQSIA